MRAAPVRRALAPWARIAVAVVVIIAAGFAAETVTRLAKPGWRAHAISSARVGKTGVQVPSGCYEDARVSAVWRGDDLIVTLEVKGHEKGDCATYELVPFPAPERRPARLFDGNTGDVIRPD